ncbi:para-nitrobenzyl esterase [Solimonas aquatica]|uniref:Carboxylic ester hydrolase n=1 Tax=Solimonas aquatica TaxID=489703 RepID=A0A1H9CF60_9GAMM|nr:carboxylesterase family protein [Solimonas aquatica]SEP99880.1 para-nitrobenzyl esterase [Solimonas aquatica]
MGFAKAVRAGACMLWLLLPGLALGIEEAGVGMNPDSREFTPEQGVAGTPGLALSAQGWLQGERTAAGSWRYLGIPYAAPPVAQARWQAPQDPAGWAGVRRADRFGAPCAQLGGYFASDDPQTFDKPYGDEDCLSLNVWAAASGNQPRPVLLFIHGGSGIAGSSAWSLYDAGRLAQELNAVVVTINYRLAFFGSLHVPALASGDAQSDSGNYGLLDQLKALAWVQNNIAAFGGDPGNVTVMGHSAGCVRLWSLLRSPLSQGKVQRAICLSGIPMSSTMAQAQARSDKFLTALLRRDGRLQRDGELSAIKQQLGAAGLRDYLHGKSTAELVEASRGIAAIADPSDGVVLPLEARGEAPGSQVRVPMIIGAVSNEASLLLIKTFGRPDTQRFWQLLNGDGAQVRTSDVFAPLSRAAYAVSDFFVNPYLLRKVDASADLLAAQGLPVYRYAFSWDRIAQPWRDLFGAYHGLDLAVLFGNFIVDRPNFSRFSWTAENQIEREQLHEQFVSSVKGYIEAGDPARYPSAIRWRAWNQNRQYTDIP